MNSNKIVDVLQNFEENEINIIGRSLTVLSKFTQEKLPVSAGFVITTLGFHFFTNESEIKKFFNNMQGTDTQITKNIKNAFASANMPAELENEIRKCYSKISGFTDAYVNLRALVLDNNGHELNHKSFTLFDIRGESKLLQSVKAMYEGVVLENENIITEFFEGKLQIVLLVQKAQQSEVSGVMFTTDIISNDPNKLSIEAVYGLESIVELEPVVPDQYIFEKSTNQILEKYITTQESMAIRQTGSNISQVDLVKISPAWQKRQKLDDKHILTLAKTGLIVEEEIGEPQEIIWSYEGGKIWINFIKSNKKLKVNTKDKYPSLQKLIDEEVVSVGISNQKGTKDVKDDNRQNTPNETTKEYKSMLVDLVLGEEDTKDKDNEILDNKVQTEEKLVNIVKNNLNMDSNNNFTDFKTFLDSQSKTAEIDQNIPKSPSSVSNEPLLEGKYFAGPKSEGDVCFDPEKCKPTDILVLRGDENLAAEIKVLGFIIEDESDILAEKLFEYFKVPVITGVPLAKKILKEGEKISIDGSNGRVFETVPYSEQVGEIEMTFSTMKKPPVHVEETQAPLNAEKEEIPFTETKVFQTPILDEKESADVSIEYHIANNTDSHVINPINEIENKESVSDQKFEEKIENESIISQVIPEQPKIEVKTEQEITEKADVSNLLNLIEDDSEMFEVKTTQPEEVKGVSKEDQFNIWGESLEKVISATKSINPTVAAQALEHVIEDKNDISQNSKEISYDIEEEYIANTIHEEENEKEYISSFIPTATKVYLNLIDEKLPSMFKNFDGVIFSSSFDTEIYLRLLEETLQNSENKEVFAVCPPYEKEAMMHYFEKIYNLRNKGYRNLSLILPDYRNKKEIAELKKMLSAVGLRRSSTFNICVNLSRTINVFRMAELDSSISDGIYIDLFRLKMNMLGVEKLSASTKYVEGMKKLVNYISENVNEDSKSIVSITGFGNSKNVLEDILKYKFWAVATSLSKADLVKKTVSDMESKNILEATSKQSYKGLKRR